MACRRYLCTGMVERLFQLSCSGRKWQPDPLDACHSLEAGCRVMRSRRPHTCHACRRCRERLPRSPMGTTYRAHAGRHYLQPQQPQHSVLWMRQRINQPRTYDWYESYPWQVRSFRRTRHRLTRDARHPWSGIWWRDALYKQTQASSHVGYRILPRWSPTQILGRIFISVPQRRRQ